jgi:Flp pilus assembly protein TadB
VVLASDGDREQAAASLREHFVRGRLTLEELSQRTELALKARTRDELRRAFDGLPDRTLALARKAGRGAALALLTGAWLLFTFMLLVVFSLAILIHGASTAELLGFLVVWLVPTFLLSRLWRRGLGDSTPRT